MLQELGEIPFRDHFITFVVALFNIKLFSTISAAWFG